MPFDSFATACVGVDVVAVSAEATLFGDVIGIDPCIANDRFAQEVRSPTHLSFTKGPRALPLIVFCGSRACEPAVIATSSTSGFFFVS
jgi:hypothetical protein